LLKKQGEYRRRNKCEHGLNRHECGICS
jgi:hypothetical protein